jgi:hypothetical protein
MSGGELLHSTPENDPKRLRRDIGVGGTVSGRCGFNGIPISRCAFSASCVSVIIVRVEGRASAVNLDDLVFLFWEQPFSRLVFAAHLFIAGRRRRRATDGVRAMFSVLFNCRLLATHEKVSRLNLRRMHASIALA